MRAHWGHIVCLSIYLSIKYMCIYINVVKKVTDGLVTTWRVHCLHFLNTYLHYALPIPVGYVKSVCYEWLLTTSFTMLLTWLLEYFLVQWYQERVTVHHVPKYIMCGHMEGTFSICLSIYPNLINFLKAQVFRIMSSYQVLV